MLEVQETLPDPLIIPFHVKINLIEEQTFSVRSDGRDAIYHSSITKLREYGVCISVEVEIKNRVLKWPPRFVASGQVIQDLILVDIKDIHFVPLLLETHPLIKIAEWISLSPDLRHFTLGTYINGVFIWNIETGEKVLLDQYNSETSGCFFC